MKPEEIARQRAVIAAATEGPWTYNSYAAVQSLAAQCDVCRVEAESGDQATGQRAIDARFIAEARTCLPAALDEVERLRAEVAALKKAIDQYHKEWLDRRDD